MSLAADASGLFWEEDEPETKRTDAKKPTQVIPVWAWVVVWVLYDVGTMILVASLVTSSGG